MWTSKEYNQGYRAGYEDALRAVDEEIAELAFGPFLGEFESVLYEVQAHLKATLAKAETAD